MMRMKNVAVVVTLGLSLVLASCGNKDSFTTNATTEFFTQDFNPATLDILWVMDNRSPMFDGRTQVLNYASRFFSRLDADARDYRMAVTTTDMQFAKGALRPLNAPVVLQRNIGTASERVALFSSLIDQLINLKTGASGEGLAASLESLKTYFRPRLNVPLVVIYVSYTDDASAVPAGQTSAADYYKSQLLALKGGKSELVRVYSVNYFALPSNPDAATIAKYRCLQLNNNGIDKPGYEDRYFTLAKALSGDVGNICATDLDAGFASQIDLTGLRLKELPNRFVLSKKSRPGSFSVSVFMGEDKFEIPFSFDQATNEIVFASVPPEGSTIQVTYLSN